MKTIIIFWGFPKFGASHILFRTWRLRRKAGLQNAWQPLVGSSGLKGALEDGAAFCSSGCTSPVARALNEEGGPWGRGRGSTSGSNPLPRKFFELIQRMPKIAFIGCCFQQIEKSMFQKFSPRQVPKLFFNSPTGMFFSG